MTELIEHIVEVDDNITITLKIPKILNVLELQGMMEKSRKLLSLALTPTRQMKGLINPREVIPRTRYTPEMDIMIKKMMNSGSSYKDIIIAINEEFNVDIKYKTLYAHVKKMERSRK